MDLTHWNPSKMIDMHMITKKKLSNDKFCVLIQCYWSLFLKVHLPPPKKKNKQKQTKNNNKQTKKKPTKSKQKTHFIWLGISQKLSPPIDWKTNVFNSSRPSATTWVPAILFSSLHAKGRGLLKSSKPSQGSGHGLCQRETTLQCNVISHCVSP